MSDTRRIDDCKVLLAGLLFIRQPVRSRGAPCSICREVTPQGEEMYRPSDGCWGAAKGAYGDDPRLCFACVAGKLAGSPRPPPRLPSLHFVTGSGR
jgi:hypothetical protein